MSPYFATLPSDHCVNIIRISLHIFRIKHTTVGAIHIVVPLGGSKKDSHLCINLFNSVQENTSS